VTAGAGEVVGGRYRIVRALGAGGMAVVELAEDIELRRPVAIKLLADNLARDDDLRRRFLREARLVAALTHTNIVHVYDLGEHGGRPYFVMEHVEGETLADLVEREGRVEPVRAVDLVVQACHGVEAAHAAGLVHRDLKPQNLLLRADGVLKVADFGIARPSDGTQLTAAGSVLGSAAYVAPEQVAGGEVSAATDVYGLGAVLYELLTGRAPRTGSSLAELVSGTPKPIVAPSELAPGIHERLEQVVMRALAADPDARPASAHALAAELVAALADEPTRPLPQRRTHRVSRRRRLPLLLASGAVLLIALGVGLALGLRGGSSAAPPPPRPARIAPVAHSAKPAQQARNLAAWLRRYSG
jgi:serine/threonine protein kinase